MRRRSTAARLLHVGPLYRHIHKVHHGVPPARCRAERQPNVPGLFRVDSADSRSVPDAARDLFTFYVGCVLNVLGTQMHQSLGYRLPAWAFFGAPKGPQPNFHEARPRRTIAGVSPR